MTPNKLSRELHLFNKNVSAASVRNSGNEVVSSASVRALSLSCLTNQPVPHQREWSTKPGAKYPRDAQSVGFCGGSSTSQNLWTTSERAALTTKALSLSRFDLAHSILFPYNNNSFKNSIVQYD